MVVSLNSISRVLVMNSVGGMPCRSAKNGERTGSLGSAAPTYTESRGSRDTPIHGRKGCREPLDSVYLLRIAGLSEVASAGKYTKCAGQRQAELLDLDRDFRSE